VDLQSDPAHCGACGTACAADERCNAGTCESTASGSCPNDTCDLGNGQQACVDFQTDPLNCGGCGTNNADNRCASNEVCVDGNCQWFVPASGCTACPCDVCNGDNLDGAACCDNGGSPICVRDGVCP
jgi:hypothetical protein